MNDVMLLIASTVDAGGGAIAWDVMLNAIPFEQRRYVMPAIKQLERDGTYKRVVRATETGASFAVEKLPQV